MQTSIRSTTDSTQHGDLPRTENDGGNSWKRLRSSLGLARDDDDDDDILRGTFSERSSLGAAMLFRIAITIPSVIARSLPLNSPIIQFFSQVSFIWKFGHGGLVV